MEKKQTELNTTLGQGGQAGRRKWTTKAGMWPGINLIHFWHWGLPSPKIGDDRERLRVIEPWAANEATMCRRINRYENYVPIAKTGLGESSTSR